MGWGWQRSTDVGDRKNVERPRTCGPHHGRGVATSCRRFCGSFVLSMVPPARQPSGSSFVRRPNSGTPSPATTLGDNSRACNLLGPRVVGLARRGTGEPGRRRTPGAAPCGRPDGAGSALGARRGRVPARLGDRLEHGGHPFTEPSVRHADHDGIDDRRGGISARPRPPRGRPSRPRC